MFIACYKKVSYNYTDSYVIILSNGVGDLVHLVFVDVLLIECQAFICLGSLWMLF